MPPKRDRPRVKGSWRDKGKGECFTRTNKSGGSYVVCNDPPRGSSGQRGVYKSGADKRKKENIGDEVKEKVKRDKAIKKIQAGARGKQVRGKEVKLSTLTRDKNKTAPTETASGSLFLEVKKAIDGTKVGGKKGLYKIKEIPAKEGTAKGSNTEKLNVFMTGNSGEQGQFNPYTIKGMKALKDGDVRIVRKKITT